MENPLTKALDLAKMAISLAQTHSHEPTPELDKIGDKIDELDQNTPIKSHIPTLLKIAQEAFKDEILLEHIQKELDLEEKETSEIKTCLEEYLSPKNNH
jgi:hypothetical protein